MKRQRWFTQVHSNALGLSLIIAGTIAGMLVILVYNGLSDPRFLAVVGLIGYLVKALADALREFADVSEDERKEGEP